MKFAVIANPSKYEVKEVMLSTIEWAQKNEVELFLYSSVAKQLHLEPSDTLTLTESDGDSIEAGEIILVMGGDGTILYTARIGKRTEKPVLGINSGRLGFMTNIQQEDLNNALDNVLAGDYTLDKRHFLRAMDKDGEKYHALNEFLFTRKDTTSMINISADYDGNYINTYWSDGLIVSSPTGSTAYNLSSGGPIVVPGSEVLVITPINPHTLTTRPLILKADKPLTVRLEDQKSDILFSYDGVIKEIDEFPYEVEIVKSKLTFNLIKLQGQNYFETLRKKLMWGQDSRRTKI